MNEHLKRLSEERHIPQEHIDYLWKLKTEENFEPKVIYDIGACVLDWARVASEVWPNAEIIVFDALDEAEFLYSISGYKYSIGLLSDSDGTERKYYTSTEHPAGNSYYLEIGTEGVFKPDTYKVMKTMKLDTVVKQRKFPLPDLVKMDVQGAELDVFNGGRETISNANYMVAELQHIDYNQGAPKNTQVIAHFNDNDFKLHEPLFCNNGPDGDYCFIKY
jgi:FkbM family methyltransferase